MRNKRGLDNGATGYKVGIDTGGTFTDLVALDEATGEVRVAKVLSTPVQPAEALLNALAEADIELPDVNMLIHGTTVATNALLEDTGATVAYLTTDGFQDIPFIQRIRREYHYDLMWEKPEPLVERYHCFGIQERIDYRGQVVEPLELRSLDAVLEAVHDGDIEALAVCYLFSYLNADHERMTSHHLQEQFPHLPVSLSSDVAPIWREYERASTTIADAYLRPLMSRYIHNLDERLTSHGLSREWSLMKSNGGVMPAASAGKNAIHTIMSGPAGGMIACEHFAEQNDEERVITLDMGGTSCDVGLLVKGEQRYTTEFELEWGIPISVPLIDIKTIGAGGGSIAWVDAGGLLHVGPNSAGAEPGPICYNQGGEQPTVTDANVILGRVAPERFVTGYDEAAYQRAFTALEELGEPLGLSAIETALAIIEIANANMSDAIKLLTLERGLDPRRFALMSFGGAGPLHAVSIARELDIPKVLVPTYPGVCSALGMLLADLRIDEVTTYPTTSDRLTTEELREQLESLIASAVDELRREGFNGEVQIDISVSMRYLGQNYEEDIPIRLNDLQRNGLQPLFDGFHQHHQQRYGYHIADETIEIVALKVSAIGVSPTPHVAQVAESRTAQPDGERQVYFKDRGWVDCPVYRRERLPAGTTLDGPMIVEESGSATLIEPHQQTYVNNHGLLVIQL